MVSSCGHCGTVLRLWIVRCPNCHKGAINLLHAIVVAGFAVVVLLIVKFI